MKQLVHETKTLAISTVELIPAVDMLDSFLGWNPKHLPYETMVFPLVKGQPDFGNPIEHKQYATQAEAEAGHQEMIQKYDPQ
jgi:hypothetical protein